MNLDRFRTPALVLACGSLILCVSFGVRSSFGLFLQPMSVENGWGREVFSFAMAIQNLLWGLLGPFAGAIGDRWGMGRVIVGCGIAYALGLVVMAYTDNPLSLYLGSGFLIGLALSGTTFATILAVIGRWVPVERRSTALGVATATGSFGQFALVPVAQWLIGGLEWRHALLGLAAIVLLIVPLGAALSGRPASATPHAGVAPQSMREALREALGERGFHLLFWGYFVCGFHIAMLSVHLPAFVVDGGLKPEHGMMAIALIGLCNMVGSFVSGVLGGRFSKKYLLSAIYLLRGVFILALILAPLTPLTLYLFAMGIGFLWLSTVPLTNGLVGQIFGMRYAGTLAAIVFVGHQIGSFIGVWLAGYVYDRVGSYAPAFWISVGLSVFAAIVNLPVNERPLAMRRSAVGAA
ncbi:MAG: MFS transporter [Betaproteobacteria bacterium]|nr:MFS transporter [Betaproteobacteria bacterium]